MKKYFVIITAILCSMSIFAQPEIIEPVEKSDISFAIIIDQTTFNNVEQTVKAYRDAIEKEGLSTYIVINDWKNPDQLKETIIEIYNGDIPLEGVVFVGDIPIPMLRGAQHMTSAFKMNEERFDTFTSSVPSDRFYDDFDLKFTYLGQDTVHTLAHYYRLLAESPQVIEREIYSGRIIAPVHDETKYEQIRQYLKKAIDAKNNSRTIDDVMFYTGHGYHSEALASWVDEKLMIRELFPQLFVPGNTLTYLNYRMSRDMKEIIKTELSDPDLDAAIFHAHGSEDMQYLLDYPKGGSISQDVQNIQRFLRSKIRSAKRRGKDLEKAKAYYIEAYGVNPDWFEGAFVDSVIAADSLFDYKLDMYSADLDRFDPQAQFVIFDECFNGSFHVEDYIAGRYLFDDNGKTIVTVANSVNCLQDKWANKFLGLLNYGVRMGLYHQSINYLENHIIGDPTFHFRNSTILDVNTLLSQHSKDAETWKPFLDDEREVLRALAVHQVAHIFGEDYSETLLKKYDNEPSYVVRLHIFAALAKLNNEDFRTLLAKSAYDPFEFIRRKSVELMGKTGNSEFLPIIIDRLLNDESRRVSFAANSGLSVMDIDDVLSTADSITSSMPTFIEKEELYTRLENKYSRDKDWLNDYILPEIKADTLSLKKRIGNVRTLRNYNFVNAVEPLTEYIQNDTVPEKLRIAILEALGWFIYSEKSDIILEACNNIISSDTSADIQAMALMTKKRIEQGFNVPLTP